MDVSPSTNPSACFLGSHVAGGMAAGRDFAMGDASERRRHSSRQGGGSPTGALRLSYFDFGAGSQIQIIVLAWY